MDVTDNTSQSTPAAERMRAHRSRRRAGLRCLTIELRETEVTELIRRVTTQMPFVGPYTDTSMTHLVRERDA
jgi:hypothetical protein